MREMLKKYVFTGQLELKSGMHIGSGQTNLRGTDSPVMLTPDGKPYIPGSSFKGVYRSTVEKLVNVIPNRNTCSLFLEFDCPTAKPEDFNNRRSGSSWNETQLAEILEEELCDTCKLFGSPYTASKVLFSDLYVREWVEATQIRDGVAIDRDSERAVDRLKYDYEVVPVGTTFEMEIVLENPNISDLGLVCVGLNEFISGMGGIGGMRSRGLGNCQLIDLTAYESDLMDSDQLQRYLIGKDLEGKMTKVADMTSFLEEHIDSLLTDVIGGENA